MTDKTDYITTDGNYVAPLGVRGQIFNIKCNGKGGAGGGLGGGGTGAYAEGNHVLAPNSSHAVIGLDTTGSCSFGAGLVIADKGSDSTGLTGGAGGTLAGSIGNVTTTAGKPGGSGAGTQWGGGGGGAPNAGYAGAAGGNASVGTRGVGGAGVIPGFGQGGLGSSDLFIGEDGLWPGGGGGGGGGQGAGGGIAVNYFLEEPDGVSLVYTDVAATWIQSYVDRADPGYVFIKAVKGSTAGAVHLVFMKKNYDLNKLLVGRER